MPLSPRPPSSPLMCPRPLAVRAAALVCRRTHALHWCLVEGRESRQELDGRQAASANMRCGASKCEHLISCTPIRTKAQSASAVLSDDQWSHLHGAVQSLAVQMAPQATSHGSWWRGTRRMARQPTARLHSQSRGWAASKCWCRTCSSCCARTSWTLPRCPTTSCTFMCAPGSPACLSL